jgi:uncharacterized protein
MIVEIMKTTSNQINLFPETILEEITQNIRTILTTIEGEVPLDRSFGISNTFIDAPQPKAMMKLVIFITESIQEYEPRVEVLEVDFIESKEVAIEGRLIPKVKVKILDEFVR